MTEASSTQVTPGWRHAVSALCMSSGIILLVLCGVLYRFDPWVTRQYDLAATAGALGGCVDFSWRTLGRYRAIQTLTWAEFWSGYVRIISGAIVGVVIWGLTWTSVESSSESFLMGVAALCGVFSPVAFNQLFARYTPAGKS